MNTEQILANTPEVAVTAPIIDEATAAAPVIEDAADTPAIVEEPYEEPFDEYTPITFEGTTPDHPSRQANVRYIEWIYAYEPRANLPNIMFEEIPVKRKDLDRWWLENDAYSIDPNAFEDVWAIAPWLLSREPPSALWRHLPLYAFLERNFSITPPPYSEPHERRIYDQKTAELFYRPVDESNPNSVPGLIIPEDHDIFWSFFRMGVDWSGWSEDKKRQWIGPSEEEAKRNNNWGWGDEHEQDEGESTWGIQTPDTSDWPSDESGETWSFLTGGKEWGNPPVPDPWGVYRDEEDTDKGEGTSENQ